MSAKVLKYVSLTGHTPTGRTRHWIAGAAVGPASSLRIVQSDSDPGVALVHHDAEGRETADTWHETVANAMEQAEWEFNVRPEE